MSESPLSDSVDCDRRELFRRVEECERRDYEAIARALNGGKPPNNKNNGWQILFGVSAVIFGLLTPMYVMIGAVKDEVEGLNLRMLQDDEREILDQKEMAGLRERFEEVETQFRGMGDKITMAHKFQDKLIEENREWRDQHQREAYTVVLDLGKIEERVKVLENPAHPR